MIGSQDRWQEDIFVACPLSDLIPEDHILRRVDRVLDLAWLRQEVAECHSEAMGRPSIDPVATPGATRAIRLCTVATAPWPRGATPRPRGATVSGGRRGAAWVRSRSSPT